MADSSFGPQIATSSRPISLPEDTNAQEDVESAEGDWGELSGPLFPSSGPQSVPGPDPRIKEAFAAFRLPENSDIDKKSLRDAIQVWQAATDSGLQPSAFGDVLHRELRTATDEDKKITGREVRRLMEVHFERSFHEIRRPLCRLTYLVYSQCYYVAPRSDPSASVKPTSTSKSSALLKPRDTPEGLPRDALLGTAESPLSVDTTSSSSEQFIPVAELERNDEMGVGREATGASKSASVAAPPVSAGSMPPPRTSPRPVNPPGGASGKGRSVGGQGGKNEVVNNHNAAAASLPAPSFSSDQQARSKGPRQKRQRSGSPEVANLAGFPDHDNLKWSDTADSARSSLSPGSKGSRTPGVQEGSPVLPKSFSAPPVPRNLHFDGRRRPLPVFNQSGRPAVEAKRPMKPSQRPMGVKPPPRNTQSVDVDKKLLQRRPPPLPSNVSPKLSTAESQRAKTRKTKVSQQDTEPSTGGEMAPLSHYEMPPILSEIPSPDRERIGDNMIVEIVDGRLSETSPAGGSKEAHGLGDVAVAGDSCASASNGVKKACYYCQARKHWQVVFTTPSGAKRKRSFNCVKMGFQEAKRYAAALTYDDVDKGYVPEAKRVVVPASRKGRTGGRRTRKSATKGDGTDESEGSVGVDDPWRALKVSYGKFDKQDVKLQASDIMSVESGDDAEGTSCSSPWCIITHTRYNQGAGRAPPVAWGTVSDSEQNYGSSVPTWLRPEDVILLLGMQVPAAPLLSSQTQLDQIPLPYYISYPLPRRARKRGQPPLLAVADTQDTEVDLVCTSSSPPQSLHESPWPNSSSEVDVKKEPNLSFPPNEQPTAGPAGGSIKPLISPTAPIAQLFAHFVTPDMEEGLGHRAYQRLKRAAMPPLDGYAGSSTCGESSSSSGESWPERAAAAWKPNQDATRPGRASEVGRTNSEKSEKIGARAPRSSSYSLEDYILVKRFLTAFAQQEDDLHRRARRRLGRRTRRAACEDPPDAGLIGEIRPLDETRPARLAGGRLEPSLVDLIVDVRSRETPDPCTSKLERRRSVSGGIKHEPHPLPLDGIPPSHKARPRSTVSNFECLRVLDWILTTRN